MSLLAWYHWHMPKHNGTSVLAIWHPQIRCISLNCNNLVCKDTHFSENGLFSLVLSVGVCGAQRNTCVDAGLRKHVIPAVDRAVAWDLCFLRPSFMVFAA